MKLITNKENCTGCGACFSICPTKSISMVCDNEGFLYPSISDSCINCGKCERICPSLNHKEGNQFTTIAYAAVSKSKRVWQRSSSGGAFSEICAVFGNENTVICGAAWNDFTVHHICVEGVSNIATLCKSKYIASSIEDCFSKIKENLNDAKKVIFCGTPCQVAGLKAFLGKSYENLLLIDLICHGVGSPLVFQTCIEKTQEDISNKIVSYEFRSKEKTYVKDHITLLKTENNSRKYILNDRYLQLFVKQHCLRKSCGENCLYRDERRQGDLTIADFKGLTSVFPNLRGSKKNYSTVVFNTQKAITLLPGLQKRMILLECQIEDIKKYNPLFFRHTNFSDKRDAFFKEYIENPEAAIDKWTVPCEFYKKTLKGRIYAALPQWLRAIIIKGQE